MFRKHPEAMQEWQPSSPAGCAKRQNEILSHAALMLRPGGQMVYSTCTFNLTENDDQIRDFLSSHPDFEAVPFSLPGLPDAPEGTLHIWPHQVRGEGHFIARLRKKGNGRPALPSSRPKVSDQDLPARAAKELEQILAVPIVPDFLLGERFFRLPSFTPDLSGLQVLRPGLCLGRFQGKTFIPNHALARAGRAKITFPVTEREALAYLHGDTLPLHDPNLRGFGVVALNGLPLGWGKASDGQIKNHYPKGLRKNLSSALS